MSDTKPRSISTIFVVDDENVIASTVAEILNLDGFNARFFVNPFHALDAAREFAPDLLITDVVMPELSGVELAIQFKEACPGCQILLFSGQAHTVDLVQGARKSGQEFAVLAKPVHPRVLLSYVHELAS